MLSRRLAWVAWLGGLATLMLELAAGRLLRMFVGSSNLVWAAVIGLILLYLTLGAWLGGRVADRWPREEVLAGVLLAAAVGVLVSIVVARPLLVRASAALLHWSFGPLVTAFLAVLGLFAWPVTLLGMVSPMVVRLARPAPTRVGHISGRVTAIATLGAFLGTFLPDLVLVPWVGIRRTFLLIAAAIGLAGFSLPLPQRWRWPLALAFTGVWTWLWFVWSQGPLRPVPGLLYERESAYNLIQVVQGPQGWRWLILNEGQGVHSVYHPQRIVAGGTWMHFAAGPFIQPLDLHVDDIRAVAIVGLAGGTAARQAAAFFPRIERITGWEIDPAVLDVGYRYFGLGQVGPLRAVVADGRMGLQRDPNTYDLIIVDAYRPPYIPAHLATREFFTLVRGHLTPRGVVAINVGRTPQNRRLVDALHATLAAVFPTVYGMDVPETYNTVLYASPRAIAQPGQNLWQHARRLARARAHPGLVMAVYNAARYPSPPPGPGWVLTDDRAAIEVLTDRLVVDYILRGP